MSSFVHFKKGVDKLQKVKGRGIELIRYVGNMNYEKSLEELGLFSVEK